MTAGVCVPSWPAPLAFLGEGTSDAPPHDICVVGRSAARCRDDAHRGGLFGTPVASMRTYAQHKLHMSNAANFSRSAVRRLRPSSSLILSSQRLHTAKACLAFAPARRDTLA